MAYNDINKHFTSPHKDPPTITEVDEAAKALKTRRDGALDEDEFHGFILQRIQKDLRKYLVNKILISIIAAPAMALFAKNTADKVPLIERVVEKVPTQAFVPVCAVGIVLLQDVRVD
ncbi:hypothetical protein QJS10_CPB20g01109 [Acorus calamus]|uniref:EF-hand domain-containing protein n=1 Tax=Acorus calamus TaxID=4465 RepID=A0AAV9C833_ACOCL|nr:hypothetical protein QJS10_CPB20g01109 [Acorus calamus]